MSGIVSQCLKSQFGFDRHSPNSHHHGACQPNFGGISHPSSFRVEFQFSFILDPSVLRAGIDDPAEDNAATGRNIMQLIREKYYAKSSSSESLSS